MRYKLLGKSGLRVSELSLGTMTFGKEWGWGAAKEESKQVYDKYREAGGNFIDTANRYTDGTSEKLTGEFIASERESVVLATKYTLNMRPGDPNGGGNHRKNMVQSLEASLKRLNTDYIDLYWLHAWDFMTPVEEVMRALDDMVRAGKIRESDTHFRHPDKHIRATFWVHENSIFPVIIHEASFTTEHENKLFW